MKKHKLDILTRLKPCKKRQIREVEKLVFVWRWRTDRGSWESADKSLQCPTPHPEIGHQENYTSLQNQLTHGLCESGWMDSTRFCLPRSSVSQENLLDLRYLQIKSFDLERWIRKQSITANSQGGLLVSHVSHKYVLCQAWPVQFSRF